MNISESTAQNKSQCFYNKMETNEDCSDVQNEDFLLGIRDKKGNFVCNNDEYDFTEEEENHLLSDDCNEECIRRSHAFDINENGIINEEENLFFIDVTPSVVNESKIYDEHEINDCSSAFSINLINEGEFLNLQIATNADNKCTDVSVMQTQHIQLNNQEHNSEIKFEMENCDDIEEEKLLTVLDDENITISDIDEEKLLAINEGDPNDSSRYNEFFRGPTKVSPFKSCLSPKNILVDSSISENDKSNFNEDLKMEEKVSDFELDFSKIMSSDNTRKNYLDLLKDKAQSVFTYYNKYRNIFSQTPLKLVHELEKKKSFQKETNQSNIHNEKEEINLLKDIAEISRINTQVSNNSFEKVNDEITDKFKTHVNEAEKTIELPVNDLIQIRDVKSIGQSNKKDEILQKYPDKFNLKDLYKQIKYSNDKNSTHTFNDKKPSCNSDGLSFCIAKESSLYNATHLSEEQGGNASLTFGVEEQKMNIEDLYDLQAFSMSNPFSMIRKDVNDTKNNFLNKIYQIFTGSKYTENLSRSFYVGSEAMDLQSANEDSNTFPSSYCKNVTLNTNETKLLHSNFKFQKKKINQLQIPVLRQSKRNSTLKQKHLSSKIFREKQLTNTGFKIQTLLNLFSLNNKIVTYILWALLSDQFKTGGLLKDIMKYLRREKALKISSKLKKDIEKFLKAAVDAGIVQMKFRRYVLMGERGICNRRMATKKIINKSSNQVTTIMNLRKRRKINN